MDAREVVRMVVKIPAKMVVRGLVLLHVQESVPLDVKNHVIQDAKVLATKVVREHAIVAVLGLVKVDVLVALAVVVLDVCIVVKELVAECVCILVAMDVLITSIGIKVNL